MLVSPLVVRFFNELLLGAPTLGERHSLRSENDKRDTLRGCD